MKLIVGLGNVGKRYTYTRHNMGFLAVDRLTDEWESKPKFFGELGKWNDCLVLKPSTYMNNSGKAVRAVMQYYNIEPADMLVIYDDKDLPFGTLRYRSKGSAGGHNGIKSIIQYLGTEEFSRIKIGIAPSEVSHTENHRIADTAAFVLSRFTQEEMKHVSDILDEAYDRIEQWLPMNDR